MAHVESYRLRDGSKRYRARWVGADGRERSRSFVLKKDADRFVLEQQRRASLGALYQAPPETLGEFVAGWLDRYALRVRPSTLARARSPAAPRRFPVDRARRDPSCRGRGPRRRARKRAPRQASSRSACSSRCSRMRRNAVSSSTRASSASRRRAASQPEMRFLDWGEVEELAANTVAPYGNMVLLAALTGLRQGELFALRDRNVDLEAKTVQRRARRLQGRARAGEDARFAPPRRPLGHGRPRAPPPAARAQAERPRPRLPVTTRGAILNDDNFRHRDLPARRPPDRATGFRFHDLRHTYAALMVAAGAHPKYLQAQMGHSSIRVTLDLYGHLFPDANRGVLETLDALTAPSTPHRADDARRARRNEKSPRAGTSRDGSDGTRTRDLRRDRPAF